MKMLNGDKVKCKSTGKFRDVLKAIKKSSSLFPDQSYSDSELEEKTGKLNSKRQSEFVQCLVNSPGSDISDTLLNCQESDISGGAADECLVSSELQLLASAADAGQLAGVSPETRARLQALLEVAGIGGVCGEGGGGSGGRVLADPQVLRKLTTSVSCALDEAAAALSRMRTDSGGAAAKANISCVGAVDNSEASDTSQTQPISSKQSSLVNACQVGDVSVVRRLLDQGSSVNETNDKGESLLALACHSGYYELVQVLLAMRANVEDRGMKGDGTPLMEASAAGHLDVVRLLISHSADVNAQSSSGNTPLMYACSGGHVPVVRTLLEAGANVEDTNENGHTPLMEAASAGHVSVAKILIENGAGINTHSNEFKESALTLACYKGHLEMVRFLLAAGADQEHKTEEMHTALMEASMDGHVEVARLLLDSGAQVNMPADSFESPLTLAACGGHVELAMLLLERGANIEEVNDEGYTPLMEAAREGHEDMVALLLSQDANINAVTEETQETALTLACCGGFTEVADFLLQAGAQMDLGASTPLMEASQEGHLELVRYLLDNGAQVNASTPTGGESPLTYASENGHTSVVQLLVERGASLEHAAEGGRTSLMKAARAGHLPTVTFLLNEGADPNRATVNNEHTALSMACHGGHVLVVKVLLQHGADPNHKLKDNATMLMEAAKNGHTQVVELLIDFPSLTEEELENIVDKKALAAQNTPVEGAAAASVVTADNLTPGSAVSLYDSPVIGAVEPGVVCVDPSSDVNSDGAVSLLASAAGAPVVMSPAQLDGAVKDIDVSLAEVASGTMLIDFPSFSPVKSCLPRHCVSSVDQNSVTPPYTPSSPVPNDGPASSSGVVTSSSSSSAAAAAAAAILDSLQLDSQTAAQLLTAVHHHQLQQQQSLSPPCDEAAPEQDGSVARVNSDRLEQYLSEVLLRSELTENEEDEIQSLANLTRTLASRMPDDMRRELQALDMGSLVGLEPAAAVAAAAAMAAGAPPAAVAAAVAVCAGPQSSATSPAISAISSSSCALPTPHPGSVASPTTLTAAGTSCECGVYSAGQQQRSPASCVSSASAASCSQQTLAAADPRAKNKTTKKEPRKCQRYQMESTAHLTSAAQLAANQQQLAALQKNVAVLQQLEQTVINRQKNESFRSQQTHQRQQMQLLQQRKQLQQQIKQFQLQVEQQLMQVPTQGLQQLSVSADSAPAAAAAGGVCPGSTAAPALPPAQPLLSQPAQNTSSAAAGFTDTICGGAVTTSKKSRKTTAAAFSDGCKTTRQLQQHGVKRKEETFCSAATGSGTRSRSVSLSSTSSKNSSVNCSATANAASSNDIAVTTSSPAGLQFTGFNAPGLHVAPTSGIQRQYQQLQAVAAYQAQLGLQQQQQHQIVMNDSADPTMTAGCSNGAAAYMAGYVEGRMLEMVSRQSLGSMQAGAGLPPPPPPPSSSSSCSASSSSSSSSSASSVGDDNRRVKKKLFNSRNQSSVSELSNQMSMLSASDSGVANGGAVVTPALSVSEHLSMAANFHSHNGLMVAAPARTLSDTLYHTDGCSGAATLSDQQLALLVANGQHPHDELCGGGAMTHLADGGSVLMNGSTALCGSVSTALCHPEGGAAIDVDSIGFSAAGDAASPPPPPTLDPADTAAMAACVDGVTVPPPPPPPGADQLNLETESNHDTALTLACSGGHEELVKLLLKRGAYIEHRDKKGFTPLILAATAGHTAVVQLLLAHSADVEAQSERTKDTPLSLACSGGRYEVVELLLKSQANKEHRNVSDYTPLSLAASGGYVNIIKLLLQYGAEINSRTGSKLGISPLMLAAMNGHAAAVKLLLDMGSDINAQIETNRNTALTLACFQGRHEVVQLLVDRRANVEHRAKTGLTPLMEAASGGYVDVGRVLLDRGADVNAAPVPSSRDTALTIAADKGHYKFVELLVSRSACVESRNKKGNTSLWLAANGGHLDVVQLLYNAGANIDSQDNRKVSCLMAAFRRGHVKLVKWMVKHVSQFPSDSEVDRYLTIITDKDLLRKCAASVVVIRVAKDRQAAEANKNATILLEELDQEQNRARQRQSLAAKKRDKKKRKRQERRSTKDDEDSGDEAEVSADSPNFTDDPVNVTSPSESVNATARCRQTNCSKVGNFDKTTNKSVGAAKVNSIARKLSGEHDDRSILNKAQPTSSPERDSGIDAHSQSSSTSGDGRTGVSSTSKPGSSDSAAADATSSSMSGNAAVPSNAAATPASNKMSTKRTSREEKRRRGEQQPDGLASKYRQTNKREEVTLNDTDRTPPTVVIVSQSTAASVSEHSTAAAVKSRRKQRQHQRAYECASGAGLLRAPVHTASTASSVTAGASHKHDKHVDVSGVNCHGDHVSSAASSRIIPGLTVRSGSSHHSVMSTAGSVVSSSSSSSASSVSPVMGASSGVATVSSTGLTTRVSHSSISSQQHHLHQHHTASNSGTAPVTSVINYATVAASPKKVVMSGRVREEGWREVTTRSNMSSSRTKKVTVPSYAISRVIGRGGSNVNCIRDMSGAHVEIEKKGKGQTDRVITIKGSVECVKMAHAMISELADSPDADASQLLAKYRPVHQLVTAAASSSSPSSSSSHHQLQQLTTSTATMRNSGLPGDCDKAQCSGSSANSGVRTFAATDSGVSVHRSGDSRAELSTSNDSANTDTLTVYNSSAGASRPATSSAAATNVTSSQTPPGLMDTPALSLRTMKSCSSLLSSGIVRRPSSSVSSSHNMTTVTKSASVDAVDSASPVSSSDAVSIPDAEPSAVYSVGVIGDSGNTLKMLHHSVSLESSPISSPVSMISSSAACVTPIGVGIVTATHSITQQACPTYSPFSYDPIIKNVSQTGGNKEKNFAAVVASGITSSASSGSAAGRGLSPTVNAMSTVPCYVDVTPAVAVVDAAKAPGYRGGVLSPMTSSAGALENTVVFSSAHDMDGGSTSPVSSDCPSSHDADILAVGGLDTASIVGQLSSSPSHIAGVPAHRSAPGTPVAPIGTPRRMPITPPRSPPALGSVPMRPSSVPDWSLAPGGPLHRVLPPQAPSSPSNTFNSVQQHQQFCSGSFLDLSALRSRLPPIPPPPSTHQLHAAAGDSVYGGTAAVLAPVGPSVRPRAADHHSLPPPPPAALPPHGAPLSEQNLLEMLQNPPPSSQHNIALHSMPLNQPPPNIMKPLSHQLPRPIGVERSMKDRLPYHLQQTESNPAVDNRMYWGSDFMVGHHQISADIDGSSVSGGWMTNPPPLPPSAAASHTLQSSVGLPIDDIGQSNAGAATYNMGLRLDGFSSMTPRAGIVADLGVGGAQNAASVLKNGTGASMCASNRYGFVNGCSGSIDTAYSPYAGSNRTVMCGGSVLNNLPSLAAAGDSWNLAPGASAGGIISSKPSDTNISDNTQSNTWHSPEWSG